MARVIIDGYEFDIPDTDITGDGLRKAATERTGREVEGVPFIRRGDTDMVVGSKERTHLQEGDRVGFTAPFVTAWDIPMKRVFVADREVYLPDRELTGKELVTLFDISPGNVPYWEYGEKQQIIEGHEKVRPREGDRFGNISPFITA